MESKDQSELCFPQLANLSCSKPPSSWSEGVFWSVLLYFICVLTVLLNLLVITSISHFRQLRTPTNLLLLSLAVCDLLVGLLVWPGEIFLNKSCWTLSDVSCSLYNFVSFTVTSASVGNMVMMSADRYVAICNPLQYHVQVTVKRIQLFVCLCWFSSLLMSSILVKEDLANPGKYKSCYGECVIHIDYAASVFDLVVTFILPLCIIVTLYTRVFAVAVSQARAVRSHVRCGKAPLPMRARKSELKAARTLGVLVLVFLMCFCPYYCVSLAGDSFPWSASVVLNMYYLNSCVNPLIYVWFYPWFRRAVKHIVTLQVLQSGSCGANIL
ncbi:trace amine-associated receptor 13c-like [Corythoichthys intestinalis]|uniref:trace amine-associated receptor 13c-like n=1 Tax=Corythoichthys intestinalis TaxID=161448 RepID=UPI0025A5E709|nr:trace amine-associated receptor 13c-like [Corythoichthys intestinalis]XP_061799449.1 trace amine-associated receptor 13c-like [Nerophis lumbriciformis]